MKPQLQKITWVFATLLFLNFANAIGQHSEFYGMSTHGGEYNVGTIVKTDGNGNNLSVVFSFPIINQGKFPSDLCEAENGKLYGIGAGGSSDCGVLFEWDPVTGIYTIKLEFNGIEYGRSPLTMMIADNGKLYGMTFEGGVYDCGVLFEWDPGSDTYNKLLDFNAIENGGYPLNNSLIQAANGKLYGTTYGGGINGCGVIFEWDPATNTYTKKLDFNGVGNGAHPQNSLIQAANGSLYGTTNWGGAKGIGVLFKWDPVTDTYTKILDFKVTEQSRSGTLFLADNGKLYGITTSGGTNNMGMLFEIDPDNDVYTIKLNFNGDEKGDNPVGSLIQSENGKLYGITRSGGLYNDGVLFEWNPSTDSYTKKIDFNAIENGSGPMSLIQMRNGKYFGLLGGGVYENGFLFEWDPTMNILIKKLEFNTEEMGCYPVSSLVLATNGNLYGMTYDGGINGLGVIFEWSPTTKTYTKKFDFSGDNGASPPGSLVQADNEKFYGMTGGGGVFGFGVLFEWDPATNIYTKKVDFNGVESGSWPYGTLTKADNNKLYGMIGFGGSKDCGVLFEWDPATNSYTKKLDFNGPENGCSPYGSLIWADNGMLYGMTHRGGLNDLGVLFEWNPATDAYTKKMDFDGAEKGECPWSSLVQADNGKLYGTTTYGGINNCGVLFEWDPVTDTFTKKVDFNGSESGSEPQNALMNAENGKLYGTTSYGGANGYGVLFEWDPVTDSLTIKYDFTRDGFRNTRHTQMIKTEKPKLYGMIDQRGTYNKSQNGELAVDEGISMCNALLEVLNKTFSVLNTTACDRYLAPSGNYLWSTSGVYMDTIPNATEGDSIITINLTILSANTSVTQNQSVLTSNADYASYQWINCDNGNTPIEGAIQQTFVADSDGSYAVIITENGCIDTSAVFAINMTGQILSTFKPDITIYPNPNNGSFSIDFGKSNLNADITVTEIDGRIILKENNNYAQVMNLSIDAIPGIYIITIISKNEKFIFKLVKN